MKASKDKANKKYRAYSSWSSMMTRCFNKNRDSWACYGGRGISVCERWRDFSKFLEDMGDKPIGYSIDRINPDGNYEPENCRWIPNNEQGKTTRKYYASQTCIVCGGKRGNRKGRCHKCNEYFRRNGVERPVCGRVPRKTFPPKICINCKKPSKPVVHGRCKACDTYLRWSGKERPSRIWIIPQPSTT